MLIGLKVPPFTKIKRIKQGCSNTCGISRSPTTKVDTTAKMKPFIVLVAVLVAVVVARPQGGGGGGGGGGEGGEGGSGGGGGGSGGGIGGFITPVDVHHEKEIHFKAHPEFKYHYKVADEHTHDFKEKEEHREGYKVKGRYSLLQPDHKVRIVDYTSDKKQGFVAHVTYKKHE